MNVLKTVTNVLPKQTLSQVAKRSFLPVAALAFSLGIQAQEVQSRDTFQREETELLIAQKGMRVENMEAYGSPIQKLIARCFDFRDGNGKYDQVEAKTMNGHKFELTEGPNGTKIIQVTQKEANADGVHPKITIIYKDENLLKEFDMADGELSSPSDEAVVPRVLAYFCDEITLDLSDLQNTSVEIKGAKKDGYFEFNCKNVTITDSELSKIEIWEKVESLTLNNVKRGDGKETTISVDRTTNPKIDADKDSNIEIVYYKPAKQ